MSEEYKGYTIDTGGDAPQINRLLRSLVDDVDAKFTSTSTWTSYTPTWTADGGTLPTLSNGTLTGRYVQSGKVVTVMGRLVIGSSTSSGAGSWSFALPVTASSSTLSLAVGASLGYISSWGIFDCLPVLASTTKVGIYVPVNGTDNYKQFARNAAAGGASGTGYPSTGQPYPWVSGSTLTWTLTYEAA